MAGRRADPEVSGEALVSDQERCDIVVDDGEGEGVCIETSESGIIMRGGATEREDEGFVGLFGDSVVNDGDGDGSGGGVGSENHVGEWCGVIHVGGGGAFAGDGEGYGDLVR